MPLYKLFQFHTVQLKLVLASINSADKSVSIPYGTIKTLKQAQKNCQKLQFQFHTVQLKR